jgi:hypothetical protein
MRGILFPLVTILLLLLPGSSVPASAAKPQTWSGYISCSTEAKGAPPGDTDAVRKCLDKGGLTVIVLDDTHLVLTIANPNAVKGQEGHRVLITGDVDEKGIHVLSVRII